MKFPLSPSVTNIFILGAGASVDYGLPVWDQLDSIMRKHLNEETDVAYTHKQAILNWLDKTGEDKAYKTIDECIAFESDSEEHHLNGVEVENDLFTLFQKILKKSYKENSQGWVGALNEAILQNRNRHLENTIAFINYNYDDVLPKNFLDFSKLSQKRKLIYSRELEDLKYVRVPTLYAHGFLGEDNDFHVDIHTDTIKSKTNYLNAVSCYESRNHVIDWESWSSAKVKIYILGLGGGMKFNLRKLTLSKSVSEIHVTVRKREMVDEVVTFLSELYEVQNSDITTYDSCKELIDLNFPLIT